MVQKNEEKTQNCYFRFKSSQCRTKRNSEEKVIIPAILKLKKLRINVTGPHVADTIFINEYKHFDVIVGMYHDQVLAPFKTMFKFNAINITLGLKYLAGIARSWNKY